MQVPFYKYQGTGNDFVIIDDRSLSFPIGDTEMIKNICDRKFGIGADGFIALQSADGFDFKMQYHNSDGRPSSLCGNGARCIVAFAKKLGLSKRMEFIAVDGPHQYEFEGNSVLLKMNDIDEVEEGEDYCVLDTGSPHFVSFQEDIYQIDIIADAHKIRYNQRFKEDGINVNFAEINLDRKLSMRTYERGVEDETLSCGTGTVAVALAATVKYDDYKSPIEIVTPGGNLSVSFQKEDSKFTNIYLKGPAQLVFEGVIDTANFTSTVKED